MNQSKKELMRTVKFILCSVSAGVIQTVSFTLLEELADLNISHLIRLPYAPEGLRNRLAALLEKKSLS